MEFGEPRIVREKKNCIQKMWPFGVNYGSKALFDKIIIFFNNPGDNVTNYLERYGRMITIG